MQAVLLRDHMRISELAAKGHHPLTQIERCIEIRGDALETLMSHVPSNCPISAAAIHNVVAHLEFIDRYPAALELLRKWLGTNLQAALP